MKLAEIAGKKVQLFFVENLCWFMVLGFYAFFAILKPTGMLKWSTIVFIIYSTLPLGFLVFGQGLCLLSGSLDLSIGQMTGFVGMMAAMIMTKWIPGIPSPVDIFIPVGLGLACGALNGFVIGILGLSPFLATLGTFMIFGGGTFLIRSYPVYTGFSKLYLSLGGVNVVAIPIAIAFLAVIELVLRFTRFGTHIYAVGGNAASSRMLGITPSKMYFSIHTICGGLCGMSALFYTGFLGCVPAGMADGTVFLAFSGAIIGGIGLQGGRGSMVNVLAGVLFLSLIEAGLSMFSVSPFLRRVVYGILVIVAILLNRFRTSLRDRILLPE